MAELNRLAIKNNMSLGFLLRYYIGGISWSYRIYVGIIFWVMWGSHLMIFLSVMGNQTAKPMEHDMKTLGPSNRIYRSIWGLGVGDSNGK